MASVRLAERWRCNCSSPFNLFAREAKGFSQIGQQSTKAGGKGNAGIWDILEMYPDHPVCSTRAAHAAIVLCPRSRRGCIEGNFDPAHPLFLQRLQSAFIFYTANQIPCSFPLDPRAHVGSARPDDVPQQTTTSVARQRQA